MSRLPESNYEEQRECRDEEPDKDRAAEAAEEFGREGQSSLRNPRRVSSSPRIMLMSSQMASARIIATP